MLTHQEHWPEKMTSHIEKVRKFWGDCSTTFAHLTDQRGQENASLFGMVMRLVEVEGKTVLDYGCGGGYLADYVIPAGARKYIGLDIAQRSLDRARERTKEYKNVEFYISTHDIKSLNPDIVICLLVIQHFPSEEYLQEFLNRVNESGATSVVMSISHGETRISEDEYIGLDVTRDYCRTNAEYISEYMGNYTMGYRSLIFGPLDYQILRYDKKL